MNNGDENVIDLPAKKKQKTDEDEQTTTTTGFSSLPKEVVGTLSTFIELGDVWNLVRSIKPEQSELVKPSFLKRNFHFYTEIDEVKNYRSTAYIKAWIEVNNNWKEMYDTPEQHSIPTEKDKIQFGYVFNNIVVAASLNLLVVVQHLVDNRDADINAYEKDVLPLRNGRTSSGTALLAALICPSVEMPLLEFLLSSPKIDVTKRFDGYIAFHHAITNPALTPEKLRLLLKHQKVDVNTFLWTPLHLVCGSTLDSSSEWKARMLLDAGADVNIIDIYGQTALEILRQVTPLEGSDQAQYKMRMTELLNSALRASENDG